MRLNHALVSTALLIAGVAPTRAAPLPPPSVQLALNGYTDSFDVTVIYPSVAVTTNLDEETSLAARYLVDAVTSASMKSRIPVDGITSATRRDHGGGDGGLDELRHEVGLGVRRHVGELALDADALLSVENDYRSFTLAGSGTYALAERNTEVMLGVLCGWDEVFPVTRSWRRQRQTTTFEAGVTQVLGPRLIGQLQLTLTRLSGFLSDAYQVVSLVDPEEQSVTRAEPRHPDTRDRRALGVRANVSTTRSSSLRLGYRYYWDTWDVTSHTLNGLLQKHLHDRALTVGLGLRLYEQSHASFFAETYAVPMRFMTVDPKLDAAQAVELQLRFELTAGLADRVPGLRSEDVIAARVSFYRRTTDAPDWHSRERTLDAVVVSLSATIAR